MLFTEVIYMKNSQFNILLSICFCLLQITLFNSNSFGKSKITAINGNQFYWTSELIDSTFVLDPLSGEESIYISENKAYIYKVNKDSTYFTNQLDKAATFNYKGLNFENYFQVSLLKVFHLFPATITSLQVNNIVVDNTGKIIYQDFIINPDDNNFDIMAYRKQNENTYNEVLFLLRKIMTDAPAFHPGVKNNKPVNVILAPIAKVAIKRW